MLRVDDNNAPVDAFLMHLFDQPLSVILKRLRSATAAGRSKINKSTISMAFEKYGRPIAPTGDALKLAIESACGLDVYGYIERKQKQLRTLGYGPAPISGTFGLKVKDHAELVDIHLGLKKNVEVAKFEIFETRFGIKLPHEGSGNRGKITIQPNPVDTCTILFRTGGSAAPLVFQGKVFLPAIQNLPIDAMKALISSDSFSLQLVRNGYSFEQDGDALAEKRQSAEAWATMCRLWVALAKGKGTIEIESTGGRFRWTVPLLKVATINSKRYAKLAKVCDLLAYLFKRAGLFPSPELSMREIADSWDDIVSTSAVATGKLNTASATVIPHSMSLEGQQSMKGIYGDFLSMERITLAAFVKCQATLEPMGGEIKLLLTKFGKGEVRAIRSYDDYRALKAKLEGMGRLLVLRREILPPLGDNQASDAA